MGIGLAMSLKPPDTAPPLDEGEKGLYIEIDETHLDVDFGNELKLKFRTKGTGQGTTPVKHISGLSNESNPITNTK